MSMSLESLHSLHLGPTLWLMKRLWTERNGNLTKYLFYFRPNKNILRNFSFFPFGLQVLFVARLKNPAQKTPQMLLGNGKENTRRKKRVSEFYKKNFESTKNIVCCCTLIFRVYCHCDEYVKMSFFTRCYWLLQGSIIFCSHIWPLLAKHLATDLSNG